MGREKIPRAEAIKKEQLVRAIELSAAAATAFGIAYRLLRHREDAEDAAQTAYVKALKAASRFRGQSNPATWLHRITVNSAIDQSRLPKAQSLDGLGEAGNLELPNKDLLVDPEEQLIQVESIRRVIEAMRELSGIQKDILVRSVFLDQSHEEIAAALGIPVGTSKSYLHRGLKKIRLDELSESEGRQRDAG